MEGIELFVELLFDKELQKQFFKECEELGVELDSLDLEQRKFQMEKEVANDGYGTVTM